MPYKTILQARKLLLDNLTPQSKQWLLRINTQDNVDLVDTLRGCSSRRSRSGGNTSTA